MNKYMLVSIVAGISIGIIYMIMFLLMSRLPKGLPKSIEIYLAPVGLLLRLSMVVILAKAAMLIFKLNLVYVLAGFLLFHSLWLIFLVVNQVLSNKQLTDERVGSLQSAN